MKLRKFDFKNPKYRWPLLLGVVGILGIFVWVQQVYKPTTETLSKLNKEKKTKQNELNMVLSLKPQLKVLSNEIDLAMVTLDSLKSIFPDQKEVPKLIKDITGVARASGILTTKFNPLPDAEREYYIENRYAMAVSGGYHQLAEFFSFLANFPLIINLGEVNIATNPEIDGSMEINRLQGTPVAATVAMFQMTTFSSKR